MSKIGENMLRREAASRKRRPYIIGAIVLVAIIGFTVALLRHIGA